jgi:hypothetical protein
MYIEDASGQRPGSSRRVSRNCTQNRSILLAQERLAIPGASRGVIASP